MDISARVSNANRRHSAWVRTEGEERAIAIAPNTEGMASSVNGGELLFLALATCYCNDVYREAAKRGVGVDGVDVSVTGQFDDSGTARHVRYHLTIRSLAAREDVADLFRHVDEIAEVHRALRCATPIELAGYEIAEA